MHDAPPTHNETMCDSQEESRGRLGEVTEILTGAGYEVTVKKQTSRVSASARNATATTISQVIINSEQ